MAEPQNTLTVFVSPEFDFATRRKIGERIIDFIRRRSKNNKGVGGRRFKNYEQTYAATKEFKQAGKSINNPNITLFGSMLADLQILDISLPGRVVVGFKSGTRSNDKSVWMREKGYDFLGLSGTEQVAVLSGFIPPSLSQNEILRQVAAQNDLDEEENVN